MARLSVSLESDQDEWLAERKRELGVSKGKVIRECVDAVRTGDSLFADSVTSGEQGDGDRLAALESRLDALEARLDADGSPEASAASEEEAVEPGDDRAADDGEQTEGSEEGAAESEPVDHATAEAAGAADDGEADDESSPRVHIPGSVGGSSRGSAASTDAGSGSAADGTLPDDDSAPAGASGGAASSEPAPRGRDLADEDEVETVDVDKSDPDAIRSHLQETLDDPALASAVFACWQQLRDRGTVHVRSMHGFHDDYPLGYDDARAWWREIVEPALVTLPGVRSPEGNGKLYRFKY